MQHIVIQRLVYYSEERKEFDIPDDMEFCIYSDITERQKLWMSIYPYSEDIFKKFNSMLGSNAFRISPEFLCIVLGQMYFPESTPEENRFRNIISVTEMNERFKEIVKDQFVRVCGKRNETPEFSRLYRELMSLRITETTDSSNINFMLEENKTRVNEICAKLAELNKEPYYTQFIAKPLELNLRTPFEAEVKCTIVDFASYLGEDKPLEMIQNIDDAKMSVLYKDQVEYGAKTYYQSDTVSFVSSTPEIKELFWNRVDEILSKVPPRHST